MQPYSLYLHIPFCRHRCGYCDFNTYAGLEALVAPYVEALCREIHVAGESAAERLSVHTIFFGGGTPSLLPAASLEALLSAMDSQYALQAGAEITLEANPGTLSLDYLRALRAMGINRLSLGVQSSNPEELRLLERQHTYGDVIQAVSWARQAGFDNVNLDLIFGLPGQALESWRRTLELALGLRPEHFSLYALTIEHGTPLAHLAGRGLVSEPDPDLAAEMYEWAAERLEQAGYCQYEISNWAAGQPDNGGCTPALACRHNLQYWRNLPYLGLGAGAHGYAGGGRTVNVLSPAAYIARLKTGAGLPFPRTPATQSFTPVDQQAEIGETMMMGLRLVQEGVSNRVFRRRFGRDLAQVFPFEIADLARLDLLEWAGPDGERLRLTPRGRLLGNQVFMRFI